MERADILLVKNGIFPSRQKAIEGIKSGGVNANGKKILKPSEKFDESTVFEYTGEVLKYVSRGGFKLEKAINTFKLDFEDKKILDMGSSTGGFTDCAIQYGAKKVYAVDVGTDQLVETLKRNPKVVSMENTDIRSLAKNVFDDCDFIVGDLSFISVVKILVSIKENITNQKLILLIKPQFEMGVDLSRKYKGVIRDQSLSQKICDETLNKIKNLGFVVHSVTKSPIKGGDGNTEFITLITKNDGN